MGDGGGINAVGIRAGDAGIAAIGLLHIRAEVLRRGVPRVGNGDGDFRCARIRAGRVGKGDVIGDAVPYARHLGRGYGLHRQ